MTIKDNNNSSSNSIYQSESLHIEVQWSRGNFSTDAGADDDALYTCSIVPRLIKSNGNADS